MHSNSSHERDDHPGELPYTTNDQRSSSIGSSKIQITPLRYKSGSRERRIGNESPQVRYTNGFGTSYATGGAEQYINSPSTLKPQFLLAQQMRESYQQRLNASSSLGQLPDTDNGHSRELLHSFKEDYKNYIDSELKVSIMDVKNNLFEQQFGFERQICNLVNKLTVELKSFQIRQNELDQLERGRSRQQTFDKSEVKILIDQETNKIQKMLSDDVSALQKWVDSLLEGVEQLKKSQEEVHQKVTVDIREAKEDIQRIKTDDRAMDSLERQVQELYRIITKDTGNKSNYQDELNRSQQLTKQSFTKMSEFMDQLHRQLLDKPDKASIDSNFMVLQNEMDNFNVKLKFHEHKNSQLEENIRSAVAIQNQEVLLQLSQTKDQHQSDNSQLLNQIKSFQEYVQDRFKTLDQALLHQLQQASILGRDEEQEQKSARAISEMQAKMAELSNMCFRNQTLSERMSQNCAQIESEVKKKFGEIQSINKILKANEEHNQHIGELLVSIEADFKRRVADQNGQINQLRLEAQKLNTSSNPGTQQLSQLETEIRKKLGEALVSIVSNKSEIQLTLNEKVNQSITHIDTEVRRKMQEQQTLISTLQSEVEIASSEMQARAISQIEKGMSENKSYIAQMKTELLKEMQDKVASLAGSVEKDISKSHQELKQKIASSLDESIHSIESIQSNVEQELRRKLADALNQLLELQGETNILKDSTKLIPSLRSQNSDLERKVTSALLDIEEIRKYQSTAPHQITLLERRLNDTSIKSSSDLRELKDSLISQVEDLKQLVHLKEQQISSKHSSDLQETKESLHISLNQAMESLRKLNEERIQRVQNNLPPMNERLQDLDNALIKVTSKMSTQELTVQSAIQGMQLQLRKELDEHNMKGEVERLKTQVRLVSEQAETYQSSNDTNIGDLTDQLSQVKQTILELQQTLSTLDSTKSAVDLQQTLMRSIQKKLDNLRQEQKEKIEFMHSDLNSQLGFEMQSRAALNIQVNELSASVKQSYEGLETRQGEIAQRYATTEDVENFKKSLSEEITSKTLELTNSLKDFQASQSSSLQSVTTSQADLQHSFDTLKQSHSHLSADVATCFSALDEHTSRFDSLHSGLDTVSQSLKDLGSTLSLDLSSLKQSHDSLSSQHDALKSEHSTTIASLQAELASLSTLNATEHASLLSRVSLLTHQLQAVETQTGEQNERVEEAGRCIELLKESVESLEDYLEKGLQSVMDKCQELEGRADALSGETQKLREALDVSKEEWQQSDEVKGSGIEEVEGRMERKIREIEEKMAKAEEEERKWKEEAGEKIGGLQENVLELITFKDSMASTKSDLSSLSIELQLRVDATHQELLKVRKTLHDECEARVEPLAREVAQVSESVDTLSGVVEGKAEEGDVRERIGEVREYIDSLLSKPRAPSPQEENLKDLEAQHSLKINDLQAQLPQLQERLDQLKEQNMQLQGSLEERINERFLEYDAKEVQLRAEITNALENAGDQIQECQNNQELLTKAHNDLQEVVEKLQESQEQSSLDLQATSEQLQKMLDDTQRATAKQLATHSHQLRDIEIEREKSNLRLEEIAQSQESQIAKASEELVNTVKLVENEIMQKMHQLRQLLDETKLLKKNSRDKIAALEEAQKEYSDQHIELVAKVDQKWNQATMQDNLRQREIQALAEKLQNAQISSANGEQSLMKEVLERVNRVEDKLHNVDAIQVKTAHLEQANANLQAEVESLKEQPFDLLQSDMQALKDNLESEISEMKIEHQTLCDQLVQFKDQLDQICEGIINDMRYVEQIKNEEIEPLKVRVAKLEKVKPDNSPMSVGPIDESHGTPSSSMNEFLDQHRANLEQLKAKRSLYLRKDPINDLLQEIKRVNQCTNSEAKRICMEEIEKSRLNYSTFIQQHNQHGSPNDGGAKDTSIEMRQPPFVKNQYNNFKDILDRFSPPRDQNDLSNINLPLLRNLARQTPTIQGSLPGQALGGFEELNADFIDEGDDQFDREVVPSSDIKQSITPRKDNNQMMFAKEKTPSQNVKTQRVTRQEEHIRKEEEQKVMAGPIDIITGQHFNTNEFMPLNRNAGMSSKRDKSLPQAAEDQIYQKKDTPQFFFSNEGNI